jgi:uncharacterized membrane protein
MKKLEISTQFWKELDSEIWTYRYAHLGWLVGVIAIMNFIYGFFKDDIVLVVVNGLLMAFALLIYISYNKHKKEVYKALEDEE